MIARIIVSIALIAMAVGFFWFLVQVLYLGTKEFFKVHRNKSHFKIASKKGKN